MSQAPESVPCTSPHVDGCGECVVNVEPPIDIIRGPAGCTGYYLCADCGKAWETSWGRC